MAIKKYAINFPQINQFSLKDSKNQFALLHFIESQAIRYFFNGNI